jgi:hypothetical protein
MLKAAAVILLILIPAAVGLVFDFIWEYGSKLLRRFKKRLKGRGHHEF